MKKTVSLILTLVIVLSACFLVSCGGLSGEYVAQGGKLGNVTKLDFKGDKVTMTCEDGKTVTATIITEPAFMTFDFESEEDANTAGIKDCQQCLFSENEDIIKLDLVSFKKN